MIRRHRKKICVAAIIFLLILISAVIRRRMTEKPEYIYLMSGVRSYQDYPMFQEFETQVDAFGGKARVLDFTVEENDSIIEQRKQLNQAVNDNTVCIIVDAAAVHSLAGALEDYRNSGIKVISSTNKVDTTYRDLHVGAVNPQWAGRFLMQEVSDVCPKGGKFLVVSDSAQAGYLTTLIQNLRYTYEESCYQDILMADILFGNADEDIFLSNVVSALQEIGDTDVIVCLSERASITACKAVREAAIDHEIRILGLGAPEGLNEYLADEELKLRLYYNDNRVLGKGLALIGRELVEGRMLGQEGESIVVDGATYQVQMENVLSAQDTAGSELYFFTEFEEVESSAFGR